MGNLLWHLQALHQEVNSPRGKKREVRRVIPLPHSHSFSSYSFTLKKVRWPGNLLFQKMTLAAKTAFQRRTSKKSLSSSSFYSFPFPLQNQLSEIIIKKNNNNKPALWILKVTNVTISYNDTHHSPLHTNGFKTCLKVSVSQCTSPLLLHSLCTHALSSSSSCWKKLWIPLFFIQNSFAVYGRSTGGCRLVSTGFVLPPSILFTFPNWLKHTCPKPVISV